MRFGSAHYGQDPSEKRAAQARKLKHDAFTWSIECRWTLILERAVERIYLMRCQLVHGAATHGGKLNRDSLRHCSIRLRHILSAVILVFIDHGADQNGGSLCDPPITT